jgi:hypothetical protein
VRDSEGRALTWTIAGETVTIAAINPRALELPGTLRLNLMIRDRPWDWSTRTMERIMHRAGASLHSIDDPRILAAMAAMGR